MPIIKQISMLRLSVVLPVLLAGAIIPSCAASRYSVDRAEVYHPTFTASADVAGRLIREGMVLCFAFNHFEAVKRFEEATVAEPGNPMGWFGIAYALGPNINNTSPGKDNIRRAVESIEHAKKIYHKSTPVEKALIDALALRYSVADDADRAALNQSYANAMKDVHNRFPTDLDVACFYADSLMNLHPWDFWSKAGEPRAEIVEAVRVLEMILQRNPRHPGANHFYIHAIEASPNPGRGLPAAGRLMDLVPEAGHLVHMASHIYIRTGHYEAAVESNRRGIEADLNYVKKSGRGGKYTMYRAHNYHFLVYAAMFEGRRALALKTAREMVSELMVGGKVIMPEVLDSFATTPFHVMERFGMWDEILQEPAPSAGLPCSKAFYHFARALACNATGRKDILKVEVVEFHKARKAVPEDFSFGNNSAAKVLDVGAAYLEGEVEFRQGNQAAGLEKLREAVRLDDALAYDEPWGWMVPARHALGALLLEAGHVEEARQVYEKDLVDHPNNGWALHGLAECYQKSGDAARAAGCLERFEKAWARADVRISASCFCREK